MKQVLQISFLLLFSIIGIIGNAVTINETTAPAITITSPTSNTNWTSGSTANIYWNSTGISSSDNVRIRFYNGSSWSTLVSSTPNDGFQNVTVPTLSNSITNARIRIYWTSNSSVDDYSSSFDISVPTITVTSPTSSTNWTSGSTANIYWNSTGISSSDNVSIRFYNGSSWSTLVSSTSNDGSQTINVPTLSSSITNARIRIYWTSNSSIDDYSSSFDVFVPTSPQISCAGSPSTSPTALTQGQAANFSATVQNTGTGAYSGTLYLKWRNGTQGFTLDTQNGLSAGGTTTLSSSSTGITSTPGTWYLQVEDDNGTVICSKTVVVTAPPPPPSLVLVQPIGFSQFSTGIAQGTQVNTDLYIKNNGGLFQGSVYVSLHNSSGGYVMDLAVWNNITIAQNGTYQTSIKASPIITQALGNGYQIRAKYTTDFLAYPLIATGNCNCSNPFNTSIYDPISCAAPPYVSPTTVLQGQPVTFHGKVNNSSNATCYKTIRLVLENSNGQKTILTTYNSGVNAYADKTISKYYSSFPFSSGSYTLRVENIAQNSYCSTQITVTTPAPNLTCNGSINMTVSPDPLIQGQNGYLSGTVTNSGNTAFNGTVVLRWTKGTQVFPLDTFNGTINVGASKTLSVTSTPIISSPGVWTLSLENANGTVSYCSKTVTVNAPTCGGCTAWTNPPAVGSDACIATSFLCQNGDIQANQDGAFNASSAISRKDLASVQYNMKFNGAAYSDYFPHKYTDIDKNAIYYKAVMAMSYLEYGDGISPFDRDADFDPNDAIYRKYGVKVILETFDVKPDNTLSCPFTDVSTSDDMYGYIAKAYQLGIIDNTSSFSPTSNLTREDAFIWLYRTKYVLGINPTVTNSDFKIPRNITTESYRQRIGEEKGGFTMHSEPIFSVLGHTPLSLVFFYDVTKTKGDTYRDSYFYNNSGSSLVKYNFESLGKGWSHNFNSYVIRQGLTSNPQNRLIVRGTDGNFTSFKYVTATTFEPETKEVYEELTKTSNGYQLKFKNQVIYHYEFQSGNVKAAYLDKITDRFGNQITLTYEVGSSALMYRLKKVEDPYGRYLEFIYTSADPYLIAEVKCVAGSIIRSTFINYKDNNENLWKYTNASGKVTEFDYYTTEEKKYLLKSIKYPKGNYVYHSFDNNRRFHRSGISPNLGTDYDISVSLNESYTSAGRTVTSVTTMRPTNGSTQSHVVTNNYDEFGNMTASSDNFFRQNISAEFNDTQNPFFPTKITNHIDNSYLTFSYDQSSNSKRGNLLTRKLYKNGVLRLEETFTYNSLNDILTYTDVGNVTTTNTYVNGFKTKVSRNGIEALFTPHSSGNGAIASITSGGTTANLGYNNYFNLNAISIAGTSMTATTTYDDASRWIEKIGFNGRVDKITNYDAMDNATSGINDFGGLNHNWSRVIDDNQNEAAFTYEGQTTSWGFDPITDELISQTFGGFSNTYSYHVDGRLDTKTNKNGHTFQQDYWNGGFKDGLPKSNGYAQFDYAQSSTTYLQSITKGSGAITFGIDDMNRTNQITYDNMTVFYGFNDYNQIVDITLPNGNIIDKTRNLNGQIIETKYNGSSVTTSTIDVATGRKTKTIYKNGNTVIFEKKFFYQANTGWLDSMVYVQPNGNVLYYEAYDFDNNGNHISKRTGSIPLAAAIPTAGTYTLTPDATNRLGIDNGTTITNNNNGVQLGGTITVNSVDELDNILNATIDGFSLSVDVDGLELARRINNTKYVYDILSGNQIIMETDLSNNPLWINIWNDGEIICRIDAQQNIKYYPIATYNGSVRMWIDETGTITHQYNYLDDFGTVLNKQEAFPMPYQYQGIYGAQTLTDNLVKMNARYYVPSQRRFISSDPITAVNGYLFAGGNPAMNIDPSGENGIDIGMEIYGYSDLGFNFSKNFSMNTKLGIGIGSHYLNLGNAVYKGINGENIIGDVAATSTAFMTELLLVGKIGGSLVAAAPMVFAEGVMVLAGKPEGSVIYRATAYVTDKAINAYINSIEQADLLTDKTKNMVKYRRLGLYDKFHETHGTPYKAAPIIFIEPHNVRLPAAKYGQGYNYSSF